MKLRRNAFIAPQSDVSETEEYLVSLAALAEDYDDMRHRCDNAAAVQVRARR